MDFVRCKNDSEKVKAIRAVCTKWIEENDFAINCLKASQDSPFDYAEEIGELTMRNSQLKKIVQIIDVDEFTSTPLF